MTKKEGLLIFTSMVLIALISHLFVGAIDDALEQEMLELGYLNVEGDIRYEM